jgi:hypothetical protein
MIIILTNLSTMTGKLVGSDFLEVLSEGTTNQPVTPFPGGLEKRYTHVMTNLEKELGIETHTGG